MYRAKKSFFRKKRQIQLGERVLLLEKASKSDSSSRHNHRSGGDTGVPRVQFVVASWRSSKSDCCLQIKKGCSLTVSPAQKRANAVRGKDASPHYIKQTRAAFLLQRPLAFNYSCGHKWKKAQRGCVAVATSVPPCVPQASMLVSAKLSGYLLSLLPAPELFLAGSESLSQSQILLLLRADAQTATRHHTRQTRFAVKQARPK